MIKWLMQSNRYKHLIGGYCIGLLADSNYSAVLAGTATAGTAEYKDHAHGGKWDWWDLSITLVGIILGRLSRLLISYLINL